MESLQCPKEHWQLKQRKSYTSYKRFLKLEVFHQSVSCGNSLIHSIACSVLWCWGKYGEWSKLIWGNWESPVPVLQVYTTSAHKSIHCCSNGRTGMIPSTTTHPTKSNQVFCLPPATKYPTLSSRRIHPSNQLRWEISTQLICQFYTTEPITSHNECLQVVKSSAIAKHYNRVVCYPMERQPYPNKYNKVETLHPTYSIKPYLVIMANIQMWEPLCKIRIGCYQLKFETGRYQSPIATFNWDSANSAQLTVWRTRSIS